MKIRSLVHRAHRGLLALCARRWFQILVAIPSSLAAIILGYCIQHRVWSWEQKQAYDAMQSEVHPIWKDLHFGRIRAGDDVEDLITRTSPQKVERFDKYIVLIYQSGFTGLGISAQDGKLVTASAGSCTWGREFFNVLTPPELVRLDKAYDAYWNQKMLRSQAVRACPLVIVSIP